MPWLRDPQKTCYDIVSLSLSLSLDQVWEVRMWKIEPSNAEKGPLISSSRVTLLSNMPVPDDAKSAADIIRKHARLWILNIPIVWSAWAKLINVVVLNSIRKGLVGRSNTLMLQYVYHGHKLLLLFKWKDKISCNYKWLKKYTEEEIYYKR